MVVYLIVDSFSTSNNVSLTVFEIRFRWVLSEMDLSMA